MKKNRRYLTVGQLYKNWADYYDSDQNLAIFLEERVTRKWFNLKNKEILDLGCGTGRHTLKLAKKNNVTAVDLSKEMLDLARKKAQTEKLKVDFYKIDFSKFKSKKKFDLIISMLVLDHIENLKKVLDKISAMSKVGTELIISNVPAYQIFKRRVLETRKINQYYHPLEEYLRLLRAAGFELQDCREMFFEEKDARTKKFDKFKSQLNEPIVNLMKFKKIK